MSTQTGNMPNIVGQLSIPSDVARTIIEGEVVIRDPANPFEANLPTAITEDAFGVLDEIDGADPGQAHPARCVRRGERKVRIQDNATIVLYARLMPSASDVGSAVTAASTGHVFGRALEAIGSGTTNQFVNAEIWADGPEDIEP